VTKEYAFELGVDCHGEAACVADGDTIETVLELASDDGLRSAVRITTVVHALISCDHSKIWIEYDLDRVPTSTEMRVHLEAYDVDKLPISSSQAPVEFRFDSQLLSQRWSAGSNEYLAEVTADATSKVGRYELVVTALNGWSNDGQSAGRCIMWHRSIEVSPNKAQLILAGCLAGAMVLTLGMMGYLLYRKRDEMKRTLQSFLAFEGLLVIELCLEAWVGPVVVPCVPTFCLCTVERKRLACTSATAGYSQRRLLLPHGAAHRV
jgi:hypothetical protein